jgi:hypothetical protein
MIGVTRHRTRQISSRAAELTSISITLFYHSPSKGWQRGRLVTLHKQPCGVTLAMRSLKRNHLIKNGDPNLSCHSSADPSIPRHQRKGRRIRPPPLLSTAASVVCARSTACSAIMAAFRDNLPPPRMYHPRIDAPHIPPVFQNRPQSEPSFRAPAPTANTPPVNMFRPIQAAALAHQHRPKSALPFRTAPLLVMSAEQSGSIHNPRPRSPVFGSPAPQLRVSPSSPTLAAPFNAHVPRPQPSGNPIMAWAHEHPARAVHLFAGAMLQPPPIRAAPLFIRAHGGRFPTPRRWTVK